MVQGKESPAKQKSIRSAVSRADLLTYFQLFKDAGDDALEKAALFAGYRKVVKEQPVTKPEKRVGHVLDPGYTPKEVDTGEVIPKNERVKFWYVDSYTKRAKNENTVKTLEILKKKGTLKPENMEAPPDAKPPGSIHLKKWSGIWPFLKSALGTDLDLTRIDLEKTIDLIVKCRPLRDLPKDSKKGWSTRCMILFDFHLNLVPFWEEMHTILQGIEKMRGTCGSRFIGLEHGPEQPVRIYKKGWGTASPFILPEPGTPILIISDLGLFDKQTVLQKAWLRMGRKLKHAGFNAVVLIPVPPRLWDRDLLKVFNLIHWDRGVKLPHSRAAIFSSGKKIDSSLAINSDILEKLMTSLSAAVRIEPSLLRAIRLAVAGRESDAGTEGAIWNHADIKKCQIGCVFNEDSIAGYREGFKELDPVVRETIFTLIYGHHQHLSPAVKLEEILAYSALTGNEDYLNEARDLLCKIINSMDKNEFTDKHYVVKWLNRLSRRQHSEIWKKHRLLSGAFAKANRDAIKNGKMEIPQGFSIHDVIPFLEEPQAPYTVNICRKGTYITFHIEESGSNWCDRGSFMAAIDNMSSFLQISYTGGITREGRALHIQQALDEGIKLPAEGMLTISSDSEEITIRSMTRPDWASAMGRDTGGLFVIYKNSVKAYRLIPGEYTVEHIGKDPVEPPGLLEIDSEIWADETGIINPAKSSIRIPDWADSGGVDRYGVFANVVIKGVKQRMRYILPGKFMMGSPENEEGRFDNERQHEVILTKGYWLAETPCTQGLWEAVLGENPAEIKGENNPVDNVSWDDCSGFIEKINNLKPGLNLGLPTEAEWEFAARGGVKSEGSIYAGSNDLDEVGWYDQNSNNTTHPVNQKKVNEIGLYDMSGNVWEWCSDWYGEYAVERQVDPVGSDTGVYRVLRGGSWIFIGRRCRCACRNGNNPDDRFNNTGVRLARGQEPTGRL